MAAVITDRTVHELGELQALCWQNSEDKGFHASEPKDPAALAIYNGNRLMLIVSEAVEAHDEIRNGHAAGRTYYPADPVFIDGKLQLQKPEGVPSEIADIVIRCFDFAGSNGFDLGSIIQEKMAYNATRERMHGKKF